jgi:hypothetical protein
MDLEEAIKVITEYCRYDSEDPNFSPLLAVLETREELADDAGTIFLGEASAAFEMVLSANREDLVRALENVS